MLTILTGRTRRLWRPLSLRLRQAYAQQCNCLLLVPEQYTLQAERDALAELDIPGFFRLEVLSPSRLLRRLQDTLGSQARTALEEDGRLVTVVRALGSQQDQLQYYRSAAKHTGFAQQLLQWITRLKEAGLDAQALVRQAGQLQEGSLRRKLAETALVFERYEQYLAPGFADSQDVARDVLQRMRQAAPYAGWQVFVYGFDVITQPLADMVMALVRQAQQACVAVVAEDAQAEDGDAFVGVRASIDRLGQMASQEQLPWQTVCAPPERLDAPAEIRHLERFFLRPGKTPLQAPCPHVRLFAAPTPYAEAARAAQEIVRQMRAGMRPSQCIVLCANMQTYGEILSTVLLEYGVPCFLSRKMPLSAHPLAQGLLAALRCLAANFRQEDVLAYIKSGFSPLSWPQAWQLENYARQYNIAGAHWRAPLRRGSQQQIQAAEPLRQALIAPLEDLRQGLVKAGSAAQSVQALVHFLAQTGAWQTILRLEEDLVGRGLAEEAQQTRQVWKRLNALFEQLHVLLGQTRIPIRHFARWLEAALGAHSLAALPPQAECVHCGQIGHLIPKDPQQVFLLGLNDGAMPTQGEELLTPRELEAAQREMGLELGPSAQQSEELNLLALWKAFSAPSQRLWISYALANEEGGALRPMAQVAALRKLLPQLVEEGGALAGEEAQNPSTAAAALDAVGPLLRQGGLPAPLAAAWQWLAQDAAWSHPARQVYEAARGQPAPQRLSEGATRAVFDTSSASISRLERFAQCPFSHFAAYGLRPQQPAQWEIAPADAGLFLHEAMQRFTQTLPSIPGWPDISQADCRRLMQGALQPLCENWPNTPLLDTPRLQRQSQRLVEMCQTMAWNMTRAAGQSLFYPQDSEVAFGFDTTQSLPPLDLALADGARVRLHGVIDRIDRYQGPLGSYLRVVDYKSGHQHFAAEKVWFGVQLQLLIYLQAALRAAPGFQPAGAFYQWLAHPVVQAQTPEQAQREAQKALRLKGILLRDPEVFCAMDAGSPPFSLAAMFNADGRARSGSPLLEGQHIDLLLGHAMGKARSIAQSIQNGVIARSPVVDSANRMPCEYCPYGGVCRLDILDSSQATRPMPPMSLEELVQSCQGEQACGLAIGEPIVYNSNREQHMGGNAQ